MLLNTLCAVAPKLLSLAITSVSTFLVYVCPVTMKLLEKPALAVTSLLRLFTFSWSPSNLR